MPIVSLLMLTCNRLHLSSKYIPLTLDRIGNVDAELLIWDNGSSDGTFDWLWEWSRLDKRITKVFSSDTNYGTEAINFLAKAASGKYIIKVDDDLKVPQGFAEKLVKTYESMSEPKLAYLAYDMRWGSSTFATRHGMQVYKGVTGDVKNMLQGDRVLVSKQPDRWMVNGACRCSLKRTFLNLGGHPRAIYGEDDIVCRKAAQAGLWVAFLTGANIVEHMGVSDKPSYRKIKDEGARLLFSGVLRNDET